VLDLFRPPVDPDFSSLGPRRHSLAGPALYSATASHLQRQQQQQQQRYLDGSVLESLSLEDQPRLRELDLAEEVDNLLGFNAHGEDDNTRTWNENGRGLPLHALPPGTALYLVEFKSGRKELFYAGTESHGYLFQKEELVIVEADRGRDLGKIVENSISIQQIQMLQAQRIELFPEAHRQSKEIHTKRIYRPAQPAEIALLIGKGEDESKAMLVCQSKVRHKKLPMEVVDAEFQW